MTPEEETARSFRQWLDDLREMDRNDEGIDLVDREPDDASAPRMTMGEARALVRLLEANEEHEKWLHSNIRLLLNNASGGPSQRCSYCNLVQVWFVAHPKTGKRGVYTEEGLSHWANCAGVERKGKS